MGYLEYYKEKWAKKSEKRYSSDDFRSESETRRSRFFDEEAWSQSDAFSDDEPISAASEMISGYDYFSLDRFGGPNRGDSAEESMRAATASITRLANSVLNATGSAAERGLRVLWAGDPSANSYPNSKDIVLDGNLVNSKKKSTPDVIDGLGGQVLLAATMKRTIHPGSLNSKENLVVASPARKKTNDALWQCLEVAVAKRELANEWPGSLPYLGRYDKLAGVMADKDKVQEAFDGNPKTLKSACMAAAWNLLHPAAPIKVPEQLQKVIDNLLDFAINEPHRRYMESARSIERMVKLGYTEEEELPNPPEPQDGEGSGSGGGGENGEGGGGGGKGKDKDKEKQDGKDKGEGGDKGEEKPEEGEGEGDGKGDDEKSSDDGDGGGDQESGKSPNAAPSLSMEDLVDMAGLFQQGGVGPSTSTPPPADLFSDPAELRSKVELPSGCDDFYPPIWNDAKSMPAAIPPHCSRYYNYLDGASLTHPRSEYDAAVREVYAIIQSITSKVRFRSGKRSFPIRGVFTGDIDSGSLDKLAIRNDCNPPVFERSEIESIPDVGIGILVDESGSMNCRSRSDHKRQRRRFESARLVTIALAESFSRMNGIKLMVAGHATGGGNGIFNMRELYSPVYPDKSRLLNIASFSSNADSFAAKAMIERMAIRFDGCKHRVLFVISDGMPYASAITGREYEGFPAAQHMRNVVRWGVAVHRVQTYGIGIDGSPDEEFGNSMYGDGRFVCLQDTLSSANVIGSFVASVASRL